MTEVKHTPLPWTVSDYYEEEAGPAIIGADGYPIADVEDTAIMEDWVNALGLPDDHWAEYPGQAYIERPMEEFQANAEFIVRAVNNHEALLQTLRDAEDALKGMVYDFEHNTGENVDADINHTMETIEQALAKAKGES